MITPEFVGIIGFGIVLVLIALRVPVGLALLVVGSIGIAHQTHINVVLAQWQNIAYGLFSNYTSLSVIPVFVLMGQFAVHTGLSADLFRGVRALFGNSRVSLGSTTLVASGLFGAVCGSSLATAATMGRIALPSLHSSGYAGGSAAGIVVAGGSLGILIPPSIGLIVYGIIVEANIVTLFAAAIIPGVMAVVFFVAGFLLLAWWRPHWVFVKDAPHVAPLAPREVLHMVLPLGIFGLVLTGIFAGWFSPNNAAAVGTVLVLLYGLFRRRLTVRAIRDALLETAALSAMIGFILLGATIFAAFLAHTGLATSLVHWVEAGDYPPYLVLFVMLLGLILAGCIMESLSMIVLIVPVCWPIIAAHAGDFGLASVDEAQIWFGILALVVIELGLITPPIGLNLFLVARLAGNVSIAQCFRGATPFLLTELVRITVLVLFPALALWLPRLLAH